MDDIIVEVLNGLARLLELEPPEVTVEERASFSACLDVLTATYDASMNRRFMERHPSLLDAVEAFIDDPSDAAMQRIEELGLPKKHH